MEKLCPCNNLLKETLDAYTLYKGDIHHNKNLKIKFFKVSASQQNEVKQVFPSPEFNGTCGSQYSKGNLVLMEEARFGRMNCSTDVLRKMDKLCSGRNQCLVNVRKSDIGLDGQCPGQEKELNYLEASYKCIRGLYQSGNNTNANTYGSVVSFVLYCTGTVFS